MRRFLPSGAMEIIMTLFWLSKIHNGSAGLAVSVCLMWGWVFLFDDVKPEATAMPPKLKYRSLKKRVGNRMDSRVSAKERQVC